MLLEDAKREWIAVALEKGICIPEPNSDGQYSGQFKLRIPKSLHRELAEEPGVRA
jgi:antitoxin HicB